MYADRIAAMAGDHGFTIHPCRGEYFVLDKYAASLITRMIYPVPPRDLRVLGIHLTPTVDGTILIGPSAEFIDHRDDVATTGEVMRTLLREARALIPSLPEGSVIQSFSGLRPKLNPPGSREVGDFIIEESPRVPGLINLLGIESPGLTASPAIPAVVLELLEDLVPLAEKQGAEHGDGHAWNPGPRLPLRFADMTPGERARLVAADPDHGRIVCRCELVTRGEVMRALNNPLGSRSILGVRMRTRATLGRCQGGFCIPRIVEVMRETGLEDHEITLRGGGSVLFPGRGPGGTGCRENQTGWTVSRDHGSNPGSDEGARDTPDHRADGRELRKIGIPGGDTHDRE